MLQPVPRRKIHETQGFIRRKFLVVFEDVEGWFGLLSGLTEEIITWRINWLNAERMSISNMQRHRMVLAGLSGWTFYIPYRIMRQFEVRQDLPPVDPENFVMPNFNHASILAYQNNWWSRTTVCKDQYPSVLIPRRYMKWLMKDIETRANNHGM